MGLRFSFHQKEESKSDFEDLLLKIICNTDGSALMMIGYNNDNDTSRVIFLLSTLCFLFSSNLEE